MAKTLLVRSVRVLPLYLFAVVVVLGTAQAFRPSAVLAAPPEEDGANQPFVPAHPPVQLTFVIGQVPLPFPVLIPPSEH